MRYILILVLFIFSSIAPSCQQNSKGTQNTQGVANASIQNLSVSEFEKHLTDKENIQLVDVRTPSEYNEGHLKNAVNIDFKNSSFEDEIKKLDKTKPTFVYCLSGGRSASAAEKMQNLGFKEIYNLDGGIMKWNSENKAIEKLASQTTIKGLTIEEYNKLVTSDNYVLVDFYAVWCNPCKQIAPMLEALATQKSDKLILQKINTDQNPALVKAKGISGIPYLELYKNGKLVWKHVGYIDEATLLKETGL